MHDLAADVGEHGEELPGPKVERLALGIAQHERDGAARLHDDAGHGERPPLGRGRTTLGRERRRTTLARGARHERRHAVAGGATAEDVDVATKLLERGIPRARETFSQHPITLPIGSVMSRRRPRSAHVPGRIRGRQPR